ncbi:MAG: Clp protease ClpP [Selenomonadaceae bacterium]|nr:Clp protease ClpP [Selenomonadaceae bacterium]
MLKMTNFGEHADIYISGSIVDDDDLVTEGYEFPRNIKKQLDACKGKTLTVYINSYGGSVPAGLAMANMIARHDRETTAIVEGMCCSIATQIFFSADHCKMPSNTFLMIHRPTSTTSGTADDMRKAAETLDVIQRGLTATYLSKAVEGITKEQLDEMINAETWLTGEQASKFFNIEVLSPVSTVNCFFPRGALKCNRLPAGVNFIDDAEARIKLASARAKGVLCV